MLSINKKWIRGCKRGFSIYISIIVVGVLLLITFSVVNIAVKQTQFVGLNRESQYALFAADAGLECAIYWDSTVAVSKFDPTVSGSPINCNGYLLSNSSAIAGTTTLTRIGGGGANIVSVFGFPLTSAQNPTDACVIVNVTKGPGSATSISSYGYNTCDTNDPNRVERGIEARY